MEILKPFLFPLIAVFVRKKRAKPENSKVSCERWHFGWLICFYLSFRGWEGIYLPRRK
jgi:hypothetical protein